MVMVMVMVIVIYIALVSSFTYPKALYKQSRLLRIYLDCQSHIT